MIILQHNINSWYSLHISSLGFCQETLSVIRILIVDIQDATSAVLDFVNWGFRKTEVNYQCDLLISAHARLGNQSNIVFHDTFYLL